MWMNRLKLKVSGQIQPPVRFELVRGDRGKEGKTGRVEQVLNSAIINLPRLPRMQPFSFARDALNSSKGRKKKDSSVSTPLFDRVKE